MRTSGDPGRNFLGLHVSRDKYLISCCDLLIDAWGWQMQLIQVRADCCECWIQDAPAELCSCFKAMTGRIISFLASLFRSQDEMISLAVPLSAKLLHHFHGLLASLCNPLVMDESDKEDSLLLTSHVVLAERSVFYVRISWLRFARLLFLCRECAITRSCHTQCMHLESM